MEFNRYGNDVADGAPTPQDNSNSGMVEMMVAQVTRFESENGIIEPLDPLHPATGGYALSTVMSHRIAAIKGILVANGMGSRLIRLETYTEPGAESLLRGIVVPPPTSIV